MENLVRNFFKVTDNYIISERQVHQTGAAIFLHNTSTSRTSVVTVEESEDGSTWTVVLFSTPTSSGNLSVAILPLCYSTILVLSTRKYVRVSLDVVNNEGVVAHFARWAPNTPDFVESY